MLWRDRMKIVSLAAPMAIAMAAWVSACHHRAPPAHPTLHVVTIRRGCLDAPPPEPMPVHIGRPHHVCPEILAGCQGRFCGGAMQACESWAAFLSREDALSIAEYMSSLASYARDAWITCGPEPAPDAGQPPADAGTRSKP